METAGGYTHMHTHSQTHEGGYTPIQSDMSKKRHIKQGLTYEQR